MKKEMKKNLFMVAAVALMALVSCNKEEINGTLDVQEPAEDVIADIPFEFSAYADGADTQAPSVNPASVQQKTTLNTTGDKPKTHWLATDKISVNGFEFSVDKETAYGESARFLGQVSESFAAPYKAVYPASAGSFDALEVPAVQTAVAGDFDQSAVIGVAYSEKDNTLAFKNVTSLLKFQVPAAADFSEKITSITITSTDYIAGTVSIDFEGTLPKVTVKKGVKTITVNCSDGFDPAKTYYAAVLPGTKSNLVVRINGYLSKQATSVTIKNSTIANMKRLPAPVDAKWRLKGSFDWSNGKVFYKDLNGYIVVKNMSFTAITEFKAHNMDGKDEWTRTAANVALSNQWYKIGQYDGGNSRIIKGVYDVYVDPVGYNIYFSEAGKELTAAIPTTRTVTVYLNSTSYTHLWCWNKDKSSENYTGGSWPGQNSTTNEKINGITYRKWTLKSCNIGAYTNMIFSKNGSSQTGEDGNTGLLMGETMFVKLDGGKTRFNNSI